MTIPYENDGKEEEDQRKLGNKNLKNMKGGGRREEGGGREGGINPQPPISIDDDDDDDEAHLTWPLYIISLIQIELPLSPIILMSTTIFNSLKRFGHLTLIL